MLIGKLFNVYILFYAAGLEKMTTFWSSHFGPTDKSHILRMTLTILNWLPISELLYRKEIDLLYWFSYCILGDALYYSSSACTILNDFPLSNLVLFSASCFHWFHLSFTISSSLILKGLREAGHLLIVRFRSIHP